MAAGCGCYVSRACLMSLSRESCRWILIIVERFDGKDGRFVTNARVTLQKEILGVY